MSTPRLGRRGRVPIDRLSIDRSPARRPGRTPWIAACLAVAFLLVVVACDRGDALGVRNSSGAPVLVQVNGRTYEVAPGVYAWAISPQQFDSVKGEVRVLRPDCSAIGTFPASRRGLVIIDRTGRATLETTDRGPDSDAKLPISERCAT